MPQTATARRPVQPKTVRKNRPSKKKVVRLRISEARLRTMIEERATAFWNAVESGDKAVLRQAHVFARNFETGSLRANVWKRYEKYSGCFIDGNDLDPEKIDPVLVLVEPNSEDEILFQIVRWTWSLPYSAGYGRRLRFLVWDQHHEAVMGIIGLQSPPVDLSARDALFQYPAGKKTDLINRTMDAYTIGAVPPYSQILGGKLVAGLIASNEVRQAYWRAYAGRKTEMENKRIEQPLVAVTTTSAFGRSSIYNRLKFDDRLLAESIGYTKGMGSVHLDDLYDYMVDVVRKHDGDFELGGYGNGPKRKWQHLKRALDLMGIPRTYFEHGLQREVFLYRLVSDLEKGMSGGDFGAALDLSAAEFSQYWLQRWALPRSKRDESWKSVVAENYFRRSIMGVVEP